MHKHFHLGRRANFPVIFLVAVVVLFGAGFAIFERIGWHALGLQKSPFDLLLVVVGIAAAFVHFLYGQHQKDTQTFVGLFEKFNTRYDDMNEKLKAIADRPIGTALTPERENTLYDYFNLCAEEQLFYTVGYIDERVWQAWLNGMSTYAKDQEIRKVWEKELKSGSYFHFSISLFDNSELLRRED